MLPSMLRTELWHPMSAHFPIALLVIGSLVRAVGAAQIKRGPFVHDAGRLMIFLGALAAWVSWYTGTLAEEEVNHALCDPEATHFHGDLAFYATLIFSGVAVFDIVQTFIRKSPIPELFQSIQMRWALVLVCLSGTLLLSYVGHLGAQLTYNQAAGVYVPNPQCTEFVEPDAAD